MPRRQAREHAFLLAFSQTFGELPLEEALAANREQDEEHPVDDFGACLLRTYYDHSAEVDDLIRSHLRGWTMERLSRVSITVLRLAIAEMLYGAELVFYDNIDAVSGGLRRDIGYDCNTGIVTYKAEDGEIANPIYITVKGQLNYYLDYNHVQSYPVKVMIKLQDAE